MAFLSNRKHDWKQLFLSSSTILPSLISRIRGTDDGQTCSTFLAALLQLALSNRDKPFLRLIGLVRNNIINIVIQAKVESRQSGASLECPSVVKELATGLGLCLPFASRS